MKVHAVNLLLYPCPQGGASARTKMPFVSSLSPSFFLPRSYLPIIPDGPPILLSAQKNFCLNLVHSGPVL